MTGGPAYRPGQVVAVGVAAMVLIDRAAPSGWWAKSQRSGNIVRILPARGEWRYAVVQGQGRRS